MAMLLAVAVVTMATQAGAMPGAQARVSASAPIGAPAADEAWTPLTVADTQVRVLQAANGRTHRIQVWSPPEPPPAHGRPVIYVLDGETTFLQVRDAARSLAALYPDVDLPVVVALGYDNAEPYSPEGLAATLAERSYDYTPAVSPEALGASFDDGPWPPTGGADAFLDFIEQRLKPAIEREFPVDRGRQVLMGHSFGGLFTLHAFFNRPDSFDTYVASSPSVWYGRRHIEQVQRAFSQARSERLDGKRLLLTVGALEQSRAPWRGEHGRAEWLAESRMVDGVRGMAERLQPLEALGLELRSRVYDGESHLSVKPLALNYGLRFALSPPPPESPARTPAADATGVAATVAATIAHPGYRLPASAQWQQATARGEYAVSVVLPVFPASLEAPASGYPVVYFLDAGLNLGIYAETMRRLEGGRMVVPAILVGLQPVAPVPAATMSGPDDVEALLDAIETSIAPRLAQRFPVDSARRVLIGQGAAAGTVLRSLYRDRGLFDAHAVLSPSVEAISKLRAEEAAFSHRLRSGRSGQDGDGARGGRLLLLAGDAADDDFPGALQGETQPHAVPAAVQALAMRLQPLQAHGLETELRILEAEDNTFSTAAVAEALLFELGSHGPARAPGNR